MSILIAIPTGVKHFLSPSLVSNLIPIPISLGFFPNVVASHADCDPDCISGAEVDSDSVFGEENYFSVIELDGGR